MGFIFFIKGLVIGFSIAAPVGPIGILCIRRTLHYGRLSGFMTGLGAAVADTFYGALAAFGLVFISNFLIAEQFWLRLAGGLFLLTLGTKTFFTKPQEQKASHKSLFGDFASTFALTITNPLTIFSYLAVFAAVGLTDQAIGRNEGLELVLGVFFGSTAWWLILSEGITFFRHRITQNMMKWINRSAGLLIFGFGIAVLLSLL